MSTQTNLITDHTTAATTELVEAFVRTCMCSNPTRPAADFTSDPKTLAIQSGVRTAFPDIEFEVTWRAVEGTRAAFGGRMRGTHLGDWRGIPATGRSIDVMGVVSFVCNEGRIIDMSSVNDSFEMAVQLGIAEQLGPKACELAHPYAHSPESLD
jgi:predicted ester cyclase